MLNPKLASKPVIVGGHHTDRSVVASASYEARALGIHVAMPIFRAYRLCPQAHFLRGNYHEYARFSEQVFEICRRFSPLVEQTGIDEGFIDLTGTAAAHLPQGSGYGRQGATSVSEWSSSGEAAVVPESTGKQSLPMAPRKEGSGFRVQSSVFLGAPGQSAIPNPKSAIGANWPIPIGEMLRDAVKRETGLNISVGIAANKLIAKIASDFAKPNGLCYVPPGREEAFVAPLALRVIPGIGRRTAEILGEYSLRTVADLRRVPRELLVRTFGEVAGRALHCKARGRGGDTIELHGAPKSISRETTFEQDTADLTFIRSMLYYLLERACWKLRRLGMKAHTVTVKLRYSDFKTDARGRSLGHYSDQDHEFYAVARALLERLYTRRVTARLVGVQLSNLTGAGQRQMHLWEEPRYARRMRVYAAADRIRERFGFSVLATGRAIELIKTHERDRDGFKLRTPCLSQ